MAADGLTAALRDRRPTDPRDRAGRQPVPEFVHGVHGREIGHGARRHPAVRPANCVEPLNAVQARGAQHRQTVVHEQGAP